MCDGTNDARIARPVPAFGPAPAERHWGMVAFRRPFIWQRANQNWRDATLRGACVEDCNRYEAEARRG